MELYNHHLSPIDNAYIFYHGQCDDESNSSVLERISNNQYIYCMLGPVDISKEWTCVLNCKEVANEDDFKIIGRYYDAGRLDELDPYSLVMGDGLCRYDGNNLVYAMEHLKSDEYDDDLELHCACLDYENERDFDTAYEDHLEYLEHKSSLEKNVV